MNSNLDVWAVQENGNDVFGALENVTTGVSIIYSNCDSVMHLGSNLVTSRIFDTILYNEECDILIMIMASSPATKEDMIDYLEKKGLKYVEVTFLAQDTFGGNANTSDNIPELWFARETSVVSDAVNSSLERNVNSCVIYPNVEGSLSLNYTNNDLAPERVDGRLFDSLIEFPDKVVLLINNKDKNKSDRLNEVIDLLNEKGINYSVNESNDIKFEDRAKRGILK